MNTAVSARRALLWVVVVALALVWVLRDLVLLVGYSVLLAYALLPVVVAVERPFGRRGPRLTRGASAAVVVVALVALVGWLLALAVPRLIAQAAGFALGIPEGLARLVQGVRAYGASQGLSLWLNPAVDEVLANLPALFQNLGVTLASWAAKTLGGLGHLIGLALLPLLSFYLLAESTAVQASALRFVPKAAHPELSSIGGAVDLALRSYVRGQAIVCVVTGIATGIVLALLGYPVAMLLGLLVAFAELVPYVGFFVAALAIALAGLTAGPIQALAGVGMYAVINWVIGYFITPRVMGRYLRMHPFIVTVSVLAGIQILGPAGALLAIPGVAMLQAVISKLAVPRASQAGAAAQVPPGALP